MYDSHIYGGRYFDLKAKLIDIMNGDDPDTSVDEIADTTQELYENGEIQATQYDNLMSLIQDME